MEYILIFVGIIIIVFAVLYYKDLKWKNKVQLKYAERKKSRKEHRYLPALLPVLINLLPVFGIFGF